LHFNQTPLLSFLKFLAHPNGLSQPSNPLRSVNPVILPPIGQFHKMLMMPCAERMEITRSVWPQILRHWMRDKILMFAKWHSASRRAANLRGAARVFWVWRGDKGLSGISFPKPSAGDRTCRDKQQFREENHFETQI